MSLKATRVLAIIAVLMALTGPAACASTDDGPSGLPVAAEPSAGQWDPWILQSAASILVPAPPLPGSVERSEDIASASAAISERTRDDQLLYETYSDSIPTWPWTEKAFGLVAESDKNPPLSSRNYALLHVAMHDAVIAAWHWKYEFESTYPDELLESAPDPSYPSEHAAIAGAASRVLSYLYPELSALRMDREAEAVAWSMVTGGANLPSDVRAGLDLGRAVAEKVIAYARTDGADAVWSGHRPAGIGGGPQFWEPPPGSVALPVDPLAGNWRPWVMDSGDQFRPPPPPAFGSPTLIEAAEELIEIQERLSPKQREIAKFWEGAEGTELPAGIALRLVVDDLRQFVDDKSETRSSWTIPRLTRALALVSVALADAGVSAWDAKYAYWHPRPENAIRDLGLDISWVPLLPTPRFPAYPSGSAGYGGAAEEVMSYLIPDLADKFEARALEQARSRLYGGIHWSYDSISLDAGRNVGALVVEHARRDGAP